MKRYNNYHKHDHVSNIFSPDTNTKPLEYILKAVEYGHTNYFTTNHGTMGDIFEARTLCNEYGLRCIAGLEGYIVPDAAEKDKRNYHIIIIPRTDKGRKKLNVISSRANIEGYYYKPRIFLPDLLAAEKDDFFITTACCAGLLKDEDSINQIFLPLADKFQDNMFLEVQSHDVEIQKEINKRCLILKNEMGLRLIAANDSHYVDEAGQKERLELLKGKNINYGDEDTFILDYPDYDTMFERFKLQGVLSDEDILEAMDSTLVFDECEEINLDYSIKMPSIYPDLSLDQRYELLDSIVEKRFKETIEEESLTEEQIKVRREGIDYEMKIVKDTNDIIHTADYFLFNTKNVDLAVNKYSGVLTRGGRGSCGSFYINKLLGMTQLDRFEINLPIFPDRFASTARLLDNRSLPDIDFNIKEQEPFVAASRELLGEHGCYPMYAPGTMQVSEAFRNVCRSKGLKYDDYNEIAKESATMANEIHLLDTEKDKEKYEDGVEESIEEAKKKYKAWLPILEEAKKYVGTIVSGSVHPCAHVISDKDILEEYGVVRLGDNICVLITSLEADEYKVLKNDYLIVKVWKLIDETFKMIGKPIIPARELLASIKDDGRIWNLFKEGLTSTLNQVDSDNGMNQAKRFGISSFEEGAYIAAAIRPAFDSWRERFLNREPYSTGSPDLDTVLSNTHSFILYQENLMQYFEWLGVTPSESIGLIKKISKKKIKPEDFQKLEVRIRKQWIENTGSEDMFDETWDMIQSCMSYGFCSAHAAATSLDMCYGAYLKVNYPLEYYTVCLNNYMGDETRTNKLIEEMKHFEITLRPIKYGFSGGLYTCDKEHRVIYKGIGSIKFMTLGAAEELLELSKNEYSDFIDLLYDIKDKTTLNSRQMDILIKLNFFEQFGDINKLLRSKLHFEVLTRYKTIKLDKIEELNLDETIVKRHSGKFSPDKVSELDYERVFTTWGVEDRTPYIKYKYVYSEVDRIASEWVYQAAFDKSGGDEEYAKSEEADFLKDKTKLKLENGYSLAKVVKGLGLTLDQQIEYSAKHTRRSYSEIDTRNLLKDLFANEYVSPITDTQKIKYQIELLGYVDYIDPNLDAHYIVVTNLDTKYAPVFDGVCLKNGKSCTFKVHKRLNPKDKSFDSAFATTPFEDGDILLAFRYKKKQRMKKIDKDDPKNKTGKVEWIPVEGEFNWWIESYKIVKNLK